MSCPAHVGLCAARLVGLLFCAPSVCPCGLCSVFLLLGGLSLPLSSAVAGTVYNVGRVSFAKGYYTGNPHKGLWGCTFFCLATSSEDACSVPRVCAVRFSLCVLCVASGRWVWGRSTDTSECGPIHLVCFAIVNALVIIFFNGSALLSTGTQCTGYFISLGLLSSPPIRPSQREDAVVASVFLLSPSLPAGCVCPTKRTLCAALDVTLRPQSARCLDHWSLCGALFFVAV